MLMINTVPKLETDMRTELRTKHYYLNPSHTPAKHALFMLGLNGLYYASSHPVLLKILSSVFNLNRTDFT